MDTLENLHVANLIRKAFSDQLSEDEKFELESWLSEPANAMLYKEIISSDNLENTYWAYQHFSIEKNWAELKKKVKFNHPRKRIPFKLVRYAAVIIPLMVGSLIAYQIHEDTKVNTGTSSESFFPVITHGNAKAILILGNGEKIQLNQDTLPLIAGVNIRKNDNSEILSYKNQSVNDNPSDRMNHLVVPRGGEYTVELSDGTLVYLNAKTKFSYPTRFQGLTREVTLQGEAYFIVAKDKNKPFVVKSDNMKISVLGTEFNFKTADENSFAEATLINGKVEVKTATRTVLLKPSWQARLNTQTAELECEKVNTLPYTAWKDGKFVFNHESMASIALRLEKWYDIDFEFARPELKDITVFGIIGRYEEIAEVLKLLRSTHSVDFRYKQNKIVVVPYHEL